ncbi:hypothetical protein SmJEL517_g04607 [Synchytrium microbalum]|uniref:Uncharacterized protein n=1 Tax=Synchytrium microbalum TaxID=1806994 RepID=A0A507BZD3_9FUNG|nr:uncharacterized protein SmJEL517_g04607 [Synchytrium microbalum]TPX32219.1 hypothetical protein SmJEL517_g04607 [Synchytrium microbalum]
MKPVMTQDPPPSQPQPKSKHRPHSAHLSSTQHPSSSSSSTSNPKQQTSTEPLGTTSPPCIPKPASKSRTSPKNTRRKSKISLIPSNEHQSHTQSHALVPPRPKLPTSVPKPPVDYAPSKQIYVAALAQPKSARDVLSGTSGSASSSNSRIPSDSTAAVVGVSENPELQPYVDWMASSLTEYEQIEVIGVDPAIPIAVSTILILSQHGFTQTREIETLTMDAPDGSPRSCLRCVVVRGPRIVEEIERKKALSKGRAATTSAKPINVTVK